MTRAEFMTFGEAEVWVQEKVYSDRKGQYLVYWEHTLARAVFEPRVSTDPMTYGLVHKASRKDVEDFGKTHTDLKIIPCYRYVWDSRREPTETEL